MNIEIWIILVHSVLHGCETCFPILQITQTEGAVRQDFKKDEERGEWRELQNEKLNYVSFAPECF
jgi:hypothetical protein